MRETPWSTEWSVGQSMGWSTPSDQSLSPFSAQNEEEKGKNDVDRPLDRPGTNDGG